MIGSNISACDSQSALALIERRISGGEGGYVCFTNVHAAVMGYRDETFREITNNSLLSVADGKPVYWVGRTKGMSGIGHIPGPDFMLQAVEKYPGYGHYFYGSTPAVLSALAPVSPYRLRPCSRRPYAAPHSSDKSPVLVT